MSECPNCKRYRETLERIATAEIRQQQGEELSTIAMEALREAASGANATLPPHPDTLRLEKLAKHVASGAIVLRIDTTRVNRNVPPTWAMGIKVLLDGNVDLRAYIDGLED